eukprot:CAMPEP_0116899396 /NCGR_PEP_ID=MMETSP0467-20121206/7978_1 /TAXON_ID=283647 /ORGANISM="Mesodinium pulex, Strain SPMC105" /LENGTH=41 /DNA_ID= /DNA_START= /DNA_END= /DNA_ORIENTATION=
MLELIDDKDKVIDNSDLFTKSLKTSLFENHNKEEDTLDLGE